jgi:hypothetical protein
MHVISGVWTLEQRGEKPKFNVTFEGAVPTLTHRAILALEAAGMCTNKSFNYNETKYRDS